MSTKNILSLSYVLGAQCLVRVLRVRACGGLLSPLPGLTGGLINGDVSTSPSPGPSNAALLVTRISVPLTSGIKYDWPGSC